MKPLKPELVTPMNAVQTYKHRLLVKVERAILELADRKPIFSPSDLPADIVEKEHRQGVVSNAWNALETAQIIERLPMTYSDAERKIFGGRIKMDTHTHPDAKGRWVAAYRLASSERMKTWLDRNPDPDKPKPTGRAPVPVQTDLEMGNVTLHPLKEAA